MSSQPTTANRVVSGMRPTGRLHLGHLHGVLSNWVRLQHEYDCFFFVADWHALTTHYEDPSRMEQHVLDMTVDWLACGVDPGAATLFIQSRVPEHAELHLLLSMVTPVGWLERVPTYKDQIQKLKDRDLTTYGFLGYPVLQTADVLAYRASRVPVGEDQVSHLEISREIARRFNHVFGRGAGFEEKVENAVRALGKEARRYRELQKRYQEKGEESALEEGRALVESQPNLTMADRERLLGQIEGSGRSILPEVEPLLTPTPKVTGLDGQKMSKSYGNTIELREESDSVEKKMRTMPTDPARVRRSDPGNPEKCPVWDFHKLYSDEATRDWVWEGCTTAGIGCLECKKSVIERVVAEIEPIRERGLELEANQDEVRNVLERGTEQARDIARDTLTDVRQAMGLNYR